AVRAAPGPLAPRAHAPAGTGSRPSQRVRRDEQSARPNRAPGAMKSLAPTAGAAIPVDVEDARLAHRLLLPACGVIAAVVGFPLVWMVWESLHLHDLRMPWLGRPFVGLANYREAIADPRFRSAMAHTILFVAISVTIELMVGLFLALVMHHARRCRSALRV